MPTDKHFGHLMKKMRNFSQSSFKTGDESIEEDTVVNDQRKHSGLKLSLGRRLLSSTGGSSNSSFDNNEVFNVDTHKNIRILVLGDSKVGKTTIIKKFINASTVDLKETIQEMYTQEITIATNGSGVTMDIEDTGGNFYLDFPVMLDISLKNTDVVVLVYSLDDIRSFENIALMRESILNRGFNIPVVVVGNKADLPRADSLPFNEIEATVCLDWEAGYVETSVTEDTNIENVFKEVLIQAKVIPKRGFVFVPKLTPSPSMKQTPFFKRMISRESIDRR